MGSNSNQRIEQVKRGLEVGFSDMVPFVGLKYFLRVSRSLERITEEEFKHGSPSVCDDLASKMAVISMYHSFIGPAYAFMGYGLFDKLF